MEWVLAFLVALYVVVTALFFRAARKNHQRDREIAEDRRAERSAQYLRDLY